MMLTTRDPSKVMVTITARIPTPNTAGYTYGVRRRIVPVCPKGWHLPSKADFETLLDSVGGQLVAGKVLKFQSGWNNSGDSEVSPKQRGKVGEEFLGPFV